MRIIFWQNIPSFHQSATIRALAYGERCEVTLAFQDDLSQTFQNRGWVNPDFGNVRLVRPESDDDIVNIISKAGDAAVHIFSGIRFPMVRKAFLTAVRSNAGIGLIVEAVDWRGVKGRARLLLYQAEFFRFGPRIDFVLAMGQLGVRGYSRFGYLTDKIYPYAYVVEKPAPKTLLVPSNHTCRLVFLGQCIRRKGLDILLSALAVHRGLNWHLDIIGDGPERDNLIRQTTDADLIEKVTFHGALQNQVARLIIAQSDCLVLPSRWDGWGAVVNEALMMGVPVICSELCGASELLGNPERGEIFRAGSVKALESVLERWINKGRKTHESSNRIKAWSRCIEGEEVADYLLEVINACADVKNRPFVPWRV